MVEIVKAYRSFVPPRGTSASVTDLLASVPPQYLTGLRRVVLTNTAALTGARKRERSRSRGRKAPHIRVAGLYHAAHRGEPAWIEIFVDKTLEGPPRWLLRLRLLRNVLLSSTLFHELGHHIHRVQRPEHKEPEAVADDWSKKLSREYVRRAHPTAWVLLRPVTRVVRWWRRPARSESGAPGAPR